LPAAPATATVEGVKLLPLVSSLVATAILLAGCGGGGSVSAPASQGASTHMASVATSAKPTVVIVHGAFADASGWKDVIGRLRRAGYRVIAPANPLRGVAADAAYIKSVLATVAGPVVLVGHS
jgi:pimeloyl-ACP methyl ester carboxylesterase